MSNNVRLGAIGVQKVSARLMEQGFLVSLPIYDDGYDLVTDWKGRMLRIQVKTTIYSPSTKFQIGEYLLVHTKLSEPQKTQLPGEFNYYEYAIVSE